MSRAIKSRKTKKTYVVRIADHEQAELESAFLAICVFLLENDKEGAQKIQKLVEAAAGYVFTDGDPDRH